MRIKLLLLSLMAVVAMSGCTKKSEQTPVDGAKTSAVSDAFSAVKLSSGGTLKKLAKGKYFYLDISQMNCSGCYDLAAEINADKEFQAAVTGGKCSGATVVNDAAQWKARYAGSFVAGHSYQVPDIYSVPTHFGEDAADTTPSVYVIEVETGKVVSTSKSLQSFIDMCK